MTSKDDIKGLVSLQFLRPWPAYVACAGILKISMGPRNRVGIGLAYRPAKLHRLAESIPGLLKSLKIPFLAGRYDNPIPIRFLAPIDCSKIPALW
jgi:hypothetical protein